MELIVYRKGNPVTVLYDDCDHEMLRKYNWTVHEHDYVVAWDRVEKVYVRMHRLVTNAKGLDIVDHKNHVKTDNRRENLRICNKSENGKNRKSWGNSKYLGVHRLKHSGLFLVSICANGKKMCIGKYGNEEEAARAYDKAARLYHGEFANPNFTE